MPPLTSGGRRYNAQYPAIQRLNNSNDILLGIFNYYRLDEENGRNDRLGWWCKLSQVCQRWRHLIYENAFHLGLRIKCTNGTPTVDKLDHLPPLPLLIDYKPVSDGVGILTEQDELGIHHALRLHGRVRRIKLKLPPSILHKVAVLMGEHFPILEHLSLSFTAYSGNHLPLILPKAFLAPNLRHLTLPNISPLRRLRVLTFSDSLVKLELTKIETSSYFRPRLLVARLQPLPQLQELNIGFSTPIPHPSTERELLGEQGAPVTLPSLKNLRFKGVGAYLESLAAQIRAPLLERLTVTLFNQIAFALPHLFHLINITEFKPPHVAVSFTHEMVVVTVCRFHKTWVQVVFSLSVICERLDRQIDCAAQICHGLGLIPALSSCAELLALNVEYREIPTELRNGGINSVTWHELLRSFIGLKELCICESLSEELSRALEVDEVGSDPGFLPNLRYISAGHNLFTSFIDSGRVVGRPVQFSQWCTSGSRDDLQQSSTNVSATGWR